MALEVVYNERAGTVMEHCDGPNHASAQEADERVGMDIRLNPVAAADVSAVNAPTKAH